MHCEKIHAAVIEDAFIPWVPLAQQERVPAVEPVAITVFG